MLRSIFSSLKNKKDLSTPLGRWGVSHDTILHIYNTTDVYDHSLDYKGPNEYCEFNIKNYINYCQKCQKLMPLDRLEYTNKRYGYLHKKYCNFKEIKNN
tara:strand:- start:219 stop:515 length:297 start_codon:yes stop_codon:yes gene_type:complete